MLELGADLNEEVLNRLSCAIFEQPFENKIGYVLYEDKTPIGIARLTITPESSTIHKIGVLPDNRKKGVGDFFSRNLLFRLGQVSAEIHVYKDDYFTKFGFKEEKDGMRIRSEELIFPCECKEGK